MSAWIVGKKTDESLVEICIKRPAWTEAQLEVAIPQNYGGVAGDYSYFECTDLDTERLKDGDEYTIAWTTNEISSINFDTETSKRWLKIYGTVDDIAGDGVETCTITAEIWKADLSQIALAVDDTRRVPIITPDGERVIRMDFTNGVSTKVFSTTNAGTYVFPASSKRAFKLRVIDQFKLTVDDVNIWD